jgi:hypothetical protein
VTLNVSLIVPDGIVVGCDSLLTVNSPITQPLNVNGTCPKCNEVVEIKNAQVPMFSLPSSTFPYAQKLFSIKSKFAMAVNGAASVNGKSMYNHSLEINANLPKPVEGVDYLETVREFLHSYFDEQIKLDCAKSGLNLALQPDTWHPFGMQLAGFGKNNDGESVAKVYHMVGGKKTSSTLQNMPALCTGDTAVVAQLWPNGRMNATPNMFSLQDAIDYVRFLIRTTADYQRFSGKLPSVGGEIDIALITHRGGFKWIAQKELYRMLERETSI